MDTPDELSRITCKHEPEKERTTTTDQANRIFDFANTHCEVAFRCCSIQRNCLKRDKSNKTQQSIESKDLFDNFSNLLKSTIAINITKHGIDIPSKFSTVLFERTEKSIAFRWTCRTVSFPRHPEILILFLICVGMLAFVTVSLLEGRSTIQTNTDHRFLHILLESSSSTLGVKTLLRNTNASTSSLRMLLLPC